MREAKNRAPMSHEMSTKNRGSILPAERGSNDYKRSAGLGSRNAFQLPADFQTGPNGRVGGNDPCNTNDDDGDFDGSDN